MNKLSRVKEIKYIIYNIKLTRIYFKIQCLTRITRDITGVMGPIVIRKQHDPFIDMYTTDQVIMISDIYHDPRMFHLISPFFSP